MTNKKAQRSDRVSMILFGLAIILLLATTIGAAFAALINSEEFGSEISTKDLGVKLNFDGDDIVDAFLDGAPLQPGVTYYNGVVSVENTGNIAERVQVVVHRAWVGEDGTRFDLDPNLIELIPASGWTKVTDSAAVESVTYRSNSEIAPTKSLELFKGLKIDGSVLGEAEYVVDGNKITTVYKYDGMKINIAVEIMGLQSGNYSTGSKSVWGK